MSPTKIQKHCSIFFRCQISGSGFLFLANSITQNPLSIKRAIHLCDNNVNRNYKLTLDQNKTSDKYCTWNFTYSSFRSGHLVYNPQCNATRTKRATPSGGRERQRLFLEWFKLGYFILNLLPISFNRDHYQFKKGIFILFAKLFLKMLFLRVWMTWFPTFLPSLSRS